MADTKISALPAASALTGPEEFAANQGGASKKVTADQVRAFVVTDLTLTGVDFSIGSASESTAGAVMALSAAGVVQLFIAGPTAVGDSSGGAWINLVSSAAGSYMDIHSPLGVDVGTIRSGDVGTGTFRDSVDARVSTIAPTVTMTTGSVGTGAFRDAVDARANAMSAARMQAGTASSGTVVAATAKTVTVTFPTAFSSAPKVTLTGISSDPGVDRRVAVVPGSETTTQFQVAFWRSTGTASFDTNWLAVKP